MGEQEALIDPTHHSLWARYVDNGTINHAAWLRACAEGVMVGTCRQCGGYLRPRHPQEVSADRTDYEAECDYRHPATGRSAPHVICAPNGRLGKRKVEATR